MNIVIYRKYWDKPIRRNAPVIWHHKWANCVEEWRGKQDNDKIMGICFRDAATEDTIVEVDIDIQPIH